MVLFTTEQLKTAHDTQYPFMESFCSWIPPSNRSVSSWNSEGWAMGPDSLSVSLSLSLCARSCGPRIRVARAIHSWVSIRWAPLYLLPQITLPVCLIQCNWQLFSSFSLSSRPWWSQPVRWCICQWTSFAWCCTIANRWPGPSRSTSVWYFTATSSVPWMRVQNTGKVSYYFITYYYFINYTRKERKKKKEKSYKKKSSLLLTTCDLVDGENRLDTLSFSITCHLSCHSCRTFGWKVL